MNTFTEIFGVFVTISLCSVGALHLQPRHLHPCRRQHWLRQHLPPWPLKYLSLLLQ